ncbi:M14 family metallopeptidase [Mangrovimonas sp. DI 80]|uniref:M14 family metallopeptidase n=1 Tax=Mangrovimonas sp. DI 80 TaxID=1779330 RepID=UPI000976EA1D|nr:M14 family metallopeptidase [Mangrovimonas sp. DI 80]OMP32116.1 peptidase [Mangrovimonas sp. DI 80]
MKTLYASLLYCLFLTCHALMAQDYPTNNDIHKRLQAIAKSSKNANLSSLGKTEGNQDIWLLTLGSDNEDQKPGIVIVGGTEGPHVLGVELALQFAERLLADHPNVLEHTTFYVFPNMSPDAYAQYHAALKYERLGNAVTSDHDRDGSKGEDPYEDLNGDGLITQMRVKSALGTYIPAAEDNRMLVKADRAKGEAGTYLVYTEGIDNDKDHQWNEDPAEGIAFNKTFTYKFPIFEPFAGDYAASQKETRYFIDYLFTQPNIYAFICFGPQNNLSTPLAYNKQGNDKKIISSILEEDATVNKMVSDLYNANVKAKPYKQTNQGTGGDLFQWAYFHFGRFSFSTPAWWIPEIKTEAKEGGDSKEKKDKDDALPYEVNVMKWVEQEGLQELFVPWHPITHPDFPNQTVEVGGLKPFATTTPPFRMVDSIAISHTNFIVEFTKLQPKLEWHNVRTQKLDGGLVRITADLYNNAPLPTHSQLGSKSRWLQKLKVSISKPQEQLVAGNPTQLIDHLKAYEKKTLTWIVKGSGNVTLTAGAPHTAYATNALKL